MSSLPQKRLSMAALLAVLLCLTAAGCYTVVHHPESMQASVEDNHAESGESCSSCHLDSEWLGYYGHPLLSGAGGYYATHWWYDYYQRPWWFDEFDYGDYGGGSSAAGSRSSWTKRGYFRRDPVGTGGTISNTTPDAASPGASPGSAASSSGQSGGGGKESKPAKEPKKTSYKKTGPTPRR